MRYIAPFTASPVTSSKKATSIFAVEAVLCGTVTSKVTWAWAGSVDFGLEGAWVFVVVETALAVAAGVDEVNGRLHPVIAKTTAQQAS
jgi:hypothetical protein